MVNEEVGQRLASKAATRAEAKIAARSASHTGRAIMRAEVGRQLVSKGAGMKGKLAVQSASHTGRVIMRTGMTQSMAQNGLTTMASGAGTGGGGILAGGALAMAFEGLSMAYDIGKVQGDLKTGRIDKKGYDRICRIPRVLRMRGEKRGGVGSGKREFLPSPSPLSFFRPGTYP